MPPRSQVAVALGVASILLLGGCASQGPRPATPTPWPTPIIPEKPLYKVQRGTVVDSFELNGQVVPAESRPLYFTVDGRLAELNVTEGMPVKQGDVLAQLEMKDTLDQLAQARLALEQAQDQAAQQKAGQKFALERAQLNLRLQELALDSLKKTAALNVPLQKAEAEKELTLARQNLQNAQEAYNVVANKPGVGATFQSAALQQATLDYQIALARYNLAAGSDARDQIAAQEIQVQLARLALREVEEARDPNTEREITRQQMNVDTLTRQVEDRQLRAPYDGLVVSVGLDVPGTDRSATRPKVGDSIPAFAPLIVVAKTDKLEIAVPTGGNRATELAVGQVVTVTHPLAQDHPFAARVISLPVQALSDESQLSGPRLVRIEMPPAAPKAAIGDYVEIRVVAAVHDNALYLPPGALRTFAGRTFVLVERDGKQRTVDVQVGLKNEKQIEIVAGLQEGDVVVGQ